MTMLTLPAEFTIYSAQACHESLMQHLKAVHQGEHPALHIDASQVVQVDAAGMQLLLALAKTPGDWALLQPSSALQQACADWGLQSLLTHASHEPGGAQ